MQESKFGVNTTYQSVSSSDGDITDDPDGNRQKIELGDHPQTNDNRSWWSTLLWQTFALLWLVPIVALLYLNFSQYVIGASAWCPDGNCYINAFNYDSSVPQARMRSFDKEDHNLLGGLQFVAKGLEIWFGIIAAALMYLITMIFAGKKEGLPIGYLTRPMEFADVIALLDPLLWVTGPSPLGAKPAGEKRLGRRVWMLIALSVFLCILINLMGPATAVLVIPSLQWIETPHIGSRQFTTLNAAHPPLIGFEGWLWWGSWPCSEDDFLSHNFTCLQNGYGESLDTWIQTSLTLPNGFANQNGLTFQTNVTYQAKTKNSLDQVREARTTNVYSDVLFWAPSRQIISNLSTDAGAVAWLSRGLSEEQVAEKLANNVYFPDPINTYVEYNKSLELQIRRNGPVVGTMMNKFVDYNNDLHYTISVDADRQIRCYDWYNIQNAPLAEGDASGNYTKCIRIGKGWSDVNKKTSFSVPGSYDAVSQKQGPDVEVVIYSSDYAVFLPNGTLPSWLPAACLSPGGKLNSTVCDWKRLFESNTTSDVSNRTQYVNTIEFTIEDGYSAMLAVDFVAYLAFTTYSLDPFSYSNPLQVVQTEQLPNTGTPFSIDPAWLLAGWSVGPGGSLQSNRTTTNLLLDVMTRIHGHTGRYGGVYLGLNDEDHKVDYISFYPVMHTLSLIDHSTHFVPEGTKTTDPDHPILLRNGRMYVWAYGLGSRTSYLGVAVAVAGALVVIWQFLLGFVDRRRIRSPTQLVVAALEHCPKGEFAGKHHDEVEMARVRFHIKDDVTRTGKYSFFEPDADSPQPNVTRQWSGNMGLVH